MTHRFQLSLAIVASLLLTPSGCRRVTETPPPSRRGPIIIVSIDTLRADHLPLYGYAGVRTPNIDLLAKDGIAFDNAYSQVPLTLPSHVSMLTGKLPAANGVRDNLGYRIDTSANPTIPSLLKKEGYATGAAVSAYVLRGTTGISSAFDFYDDAIDNSEDATVGELQRAGSRTAASAEKWIERNGTQPFFFLLHLYEPHAPYKPPEPFRSEYAGHEYDGEIAAADEVLGHFIDFLKTRKLYDEATIIFMSDHGEGLGDHGESEHGIFLYREAIRVPLVVKLPGAVKGGTRVATPVELLDILPTIASIAGIVAPEGATGRSLISIADGEHPDRRVYSETMYPRIHLGLSDLASLVDSTHHYIDAPRAELYDLASDPREKRNVLVDQRRATAAMKRDLATFDRRLKAAANVSPEEAAKLSALGYLSAAVPSADTSGDPKDHIRDVESLAEAAKLTEAGRAQDAIGILRGLVQRNPKFADAWSLLARAFERTGRLEDSIAAYRKTIEIAPMLAPGTAISLAESYLALGNIDESIEHARLGMAAHPGAAHAVLAKAYLAKRDLAAVQSEAAWLMNDPSWRVEGLIAMARLRTAEKRLDDAWSFAEQARVESVARGERVPLMASVRGDLLARKGQFASAEEAFREEMRLFPRDREAFVRLAAMQSLQGRSVDAEKTLEQMVNASPYESSYLLAAKMYQQLGDADAAARWRARAR